MHACARHETMIWEIVHHKTLDLDNRKVDSGLLKQGSQQSATLIFL